ncbi:MAG: PaaI family thioesterase [Chloroflexota bacterium]
MPYPEYFQKLEQLYYRNPINEFYDTTIKIEAGKAQIVTQVRPDLLHGGGMLHGSVYFKALDDACTFAAATLKENEIPVTASFNIHFLRPISKGSFTAVGRVLHQSRRLIVTEAEAFDENGRKLAYGSGSFMIASGGMPKL